MTMKKKNREECPNKKVPFLWELSLSEQLIRSED